jgi:hypothetical protein
MTKSHPMVIDPLACGHSKPLDMHAGQLILVLELCERA